MKLQTMKSQSGKTKYFGVNIDNEFYRLQSKVKVMQFIELSCSLPKHFDLELITVKPGRFKFAINGTNFGVISKRAFNKLSTYFTKNNEKLQNSQINQQPQLLLRGDCQEDSQWGGEILSGHSLVAGNSYVESQSGGGILSTLGDIQNGTEFFNRLEAIDRELTERENSECEFTSRLAKIRRGQLEIALEQREIAETQRRIGDTLAEADRIVQESSVVADRVRALIAKRSKQLV